MIRVPYDLTAFASDFWGDPYNAVQTKRPTTVADALYSMSDKDWDIMARDIFNLPGDMVDVYDAMEMVRRTNTCTNLDSPVEVWIDEYGYYTVLVYNPVKKG